MSKCLGCAGFESTDVLTVSIWSIRPNHQPQANNRAKQVQAHVLGPAQTQPLEASPRSGGPMKKASIESHAHMRKKRAGGYEHGTLRATQPVLLGEEGCFNPVAHMKLL